MQTDNIVTSMTNHTITFCLLSIITLISCGQTNETTSSTEHASTVQFNAELVYDGTPVTKTEAEWQKQLSPEQFYVCRQEGTERAFTGAYWNTHEAGDYFCVACGLPLFSSDTKFDSGTGWPSFYKPIHKENVHENSDESFGMVRTEVECARCGSHLGHVFDDAYNQPTGLRYCINSVSLQFHKK
jgi:peptide-methionine (R)-S-oxide reductase